MPTEPSLPKSQARLGFVYFRGAIRAVDRVLRLSEGGEWGPAKLPLNLDGARPGVRPSRSGVLGAFRRSRLACRYATEADGDPDRSPFTRG